MSARLLAKRRILSSKSVGMSCLSWLLQFSGVVIKSSLTVVDSCLDQSSTGRFDDLDGLLSVQRRLETKSSGNKAEIFVTMVKPELLPYSSDVACVTDVIVSKSVSPRGPVISSI